MIQVGRHATDTFFTSIRLWAATLSSVLNVCAARGRWLGSKSVKFCVDIILVGRVFGIVILPKYGVREVFLDFLVKRYSKLVEDRFLVVSGRQGAAKKVQPRLLSMPSDSTPGQQRGNVLGGGPGIGSNSALRNPFDIISRVTGFLH